MSDAARSERRGLAPAVAQMPNGLRQGDVQGVELVAVGTR